MATTNNTVKVYVTFHNPPMSWSNEAVGEFQKHLVEEEDWPDNIGQKTEKMEMLRYYEHGGLWYAVASYVINIDVRHV